MLPRDEFLATKYRPESNPYRYDANISFEGILPVDNSLPVKLSVITSTCFRYSQLQRTLESLARQNWKEFEVVICDDGDPEDLSRIYNPWKDYLRIKVVRREREYFRNDPTGGFIESFKVADGEYFATMQPEIMLSPDACEFLYLGHKFSSKFPCRYNPRWMDKTRIGLLFISEEEAKQHENTWCVVPTYFFNPSMTHALDQVDWHTDMNNVKNVISFWDGGGGFSNQNNRYWHGWMNDKTKDFPWWFVASAHRESPVWKNMIELVSHAGIDFYLLDCRSAFRYVDIVPMTPDLVCGYHQEHIRYSFSAQGEGDQLGSYLSKLVPGWRES